MRVTEAPKERAAARFKALQEAASIGFADLDEARYRDFESVDDLAAYLRDLSEWALSGARVYR